MRIDAALADFLQSGVIVAVGSRDGRLRPEVTRAWGPRAAPRSEHLELFLSRTISARTLENLRDNGSLAVTFGCPTSYRCVQLKGQCVALDDPDPEDRGRVQEHRRALGRALARAGMTHDLGRQLRLDDLVRARVEVREVFDQTPGPRAGARL